MAGYLKISNSHVYEGGYCAGADGIENGTFVELNASNELIPTTTTKDVDLRVREKTLLWKKPAVILDVINEGTNEVYFVENEWEEYEDAGEYNTAEYSVDKGHAMKVRRLERRDQVIMTIDDTLYASLTVGQTVHPAAAGTIA